MNRRTYECITSGEACEEGGLGNPGSKHGGYLSIGRDDLAGMLAVNKA